eukprot:scaffold3849_cov179-Amphora_coffeaeformis.AAC.15
MELTASRWFSGTDKTARASRGMAFQGGGHANTIIGPERRALGRQPRRGGRQRNEFQQDGVFGKVMCRCGILFRDHIDVSLKYNGIGIDPRARTRSKDNHISNLVLLPFQAVLIRNRLNILQHGLFLFTRAGNTTQCCKVLPQGGRFETLYGLNVLGWDYRGEVFGRRGGG